jgi:UDP-N-acetylmuramoyl-tripeptide--D-alanyl-D-alanine ligase
MAGVHGGYVNLFRWGTLFYARTPLNVLARRRSRNAQVVFITGTQGKTTTLRAARHLLGLPVDVWSNSNTNCRGEVPWSLLRQPRHATVMPVEAPDGNGELPVFIDALRPDAAVITCVGMEHVGLLGSMEAVVKEFADLLAALPADGFAVINADDPHLTALPTRARRFTFGRTPGCDVTIIEAHRTAGRLSVTLEADRRRYRVDSRLVGLHYQHVVAATVALALAWGIPVQEAVDRLQDLPPTPARLEPFTSIRGATILSDDYKATPETVLAGLAEVGQWPAETRWAVLGDLTNLPGPDPRPEYEAVAAACAAQVDRVVTFGPGWGEHADVWSGLPVRVDHAESVLAAADPVLEGHGPRDVIYVKGCEDIRARRITLRLTGLRVTCARVECKKTLVRCENCSLVARR